MLISDSCKSSCLYFSSIWMKLVWLFNLLHINIDEKILEYNLIRLFNVASICMFLEMIPWHSTTNQEWISGEDWFSLSSSSSRIVPLTLSPHHHLMKGPDLVYAMMSLISFCSILGIARRRSLTKIFLIHWLLKFCPYIYNVLLALVAGTLLWCYQLGRRAMWQLFLSIMSSSGFL